MNATQQQAIRDDAERRLEELRAVAKSLWVDRDDAHVASELTVSWARSGKPKPC